MTDFTIIRYRMRASRQKADLEMHTEKKILIHSLHCAIFTQQALVTLCGRFQQLSFTYYEAFLHLHLLPRCKYSANTQVHRCFSCEPIPLSQMWAQPKATAYRTSFPF